MNTRFVPSIPTPKKPVTYQHPSIQMPNKQDSRKSSTVETNNLDTSFNGTNSHGITALVSAFNGGTGTRSSRSSSVASTQPVVSNLVKIYSDVTALKQKPRHDSVVSTGKHDELTKIFEQASNNSQRQQTSIVKRPSQAYEEAYEEITWDNLVHG